VVTAVQPANPEPILWHAEPGETVQLRATAAAAYKALQPVKLTIYRSDQTPVKTFETTVAIGPGVTELPFTWDGTQDAPLGGIAEPGVYLFQWQVGAAGPTMDADQDKSSGLVCDPLGAEAELVSDDGGLVTYRVRYALTSTASLGASLGTVTVFDPSLAIIRERTLASDELTLGSHDVLVALPPPDKAARYCFLVAARDGLSGGDRSHRQRWALQCNHGVTLCAAAVFGFSAAPFPWSSAGTIESAVTAWSLLRDGRFVHGTRIARCARARTTANALDDPLGRPPAVWPDEPRKDVEAKEGWYALHWSRVITGTTIWAYFGHGGGGSNWAGKFVEFANANTVLAAGPFSPSLGGGRTARYISSLAAQRLTGVELAVVAACNDAGGSPTPMEAALKGKGAQHTIAFNRVVNLNLARRWWKLFWQYALVGERPESTRDGLGWAAAARLAQQTSLEEIGGSVMGRIGWTPFTNYDGQPVDDRTGG